MFKQVKLRDVVFEPARFCAPLSGLSHSAFRRVVSSLGGCGAFWTEMLTARHLLRDQLHRSPYVRRDPGESRLIYQLLLREQDPLERMMDRLAGLQPDGVDVNLSYHTPAMRHTDAASRLYFNSRSLANTLRTLRKLWPGLLLAKFRLGRDEEGWRNVLLERLKICEAEGVDAVTVHPRFLDDTVNRRRTRHEELAWLARETRLPLIANGDLHSRVHVRALAKELAPAQAVMVGRMAAIQPWVFAHWNKPGPINHAALWQRMAEEIHKDFPPHQSLGRLRLFTRYYARNFVHGHYLANAVQKATSRVEALDKGLRFLDSRPECEDVPSLQGL